MPGIGGLELQRVLLQRGIQLPVIFLTGHGDVPMAVQAMQDGAMDFIQKPFNPQRLLDLVQACLEQDRRCQARRHSGRRRWTVCEAHQARARRRQPS
jgi:FixJ family two-component response regulator